MTFIVCSIDPFAPVPLTGTSEEYYMLTTPGASQYLGRYWTLNSTHNDILSWQSYDVVYYEAKDMWTRARGTTWSLNLYLFQLNMHGQICNRVQVVAIVNQFSSVWVGVDPSLQIIQTPQQSSVDPEDEPGVYSSPEETIKAYRSGKFVDWKKIAERHGVK